MTAVMEAVLADDFGLDPVASREGDGWYRFTIEGHEFQGGVHQDFRVSVVLCRNDEDVNLTKLMASLRAANKGLTDAKFAEADGYIHVRAACAHKDVTAAKLRTMIDACRATAASATGMALRSKYRSWN